MTRNILSPENLNELFSDVRREEPQNRNNNQQEFLVHFKESLNTHKHKAQLKRVYNAFKVPGSMLEIACRTGIERANICWYVRSLRKRNRIQLIEKGYCSITKQLVGIYSTDEALFCSDDSQLKLF